MDKVINTGLLRNPFNWVTVYLMVVFGALAVKYIFPNGTVTAPKLPSSI